jgi:D-psicose/D-tagatose/L-ribulose 3-epimerase
MFRFGVDSLIWTEDFALKDLQLIRKAKALGFEVLDINVGHPERFATEAVREKVKEVGIEVVTTIGLPSDSNLIAPNPETRRNGIKTLKKLVDINIEIGSRILGGVNYAAWGYLSGRPRTEDEWGWSVESMREVALYAQNKSDMIIAVEPVNRFETHFLNVAEDAVKYCNDVGIGNMKVHLDSFHMIREEQSFAGAVEICGEKYLGYVHACENNRGIPGTGLVPWEEFFAALRKINYNGPIVIESFDPGFVELNRLCAMWRKFAETGEELAIKGLHNLKNIEKRLN